MTLTAEKRLKSAAIALVFGGLFIATAGFCYFKFTPKTFQAAAKIRVWQTGRYDTNDTHVAFDADRLSRSECQVLRSDAILDRAIQGLGPPWTSPGGRDRLRLMTDARQLSDSGVIELSASGGDPVQIAAVANKIAQAYADYRQATRAETTHERLEALQAELATLDPKIMQAWSNLDRACQAFTPSSNDPVLYQPDSYLLLQSSRAKLELQVGEKTQRLAGFKSMDPETLQQTLCVLDGRTNVLLVASLAGLNRAKADLSAARIQHGSASVEVQQAEKIAAADETNVNRAVEGVLTSQSLELASLKTALDTMNQKLSRATTNLAVVIAARPELAAPARELEQLEHQRDALQMRMKVENSAQASLPIMPIAISVNVVEAAEPPAKPMSPDAGTANATMLAGLILFAAGLFLRFLLPKPKLVPARRG